jgi:hypothetical protein
MSVILSEPETWQDPFETLAHSLGALFGKGGEKQPEVLKGVREFAALNHDSVNSHHAFILAKAFREMLNQMERAVTPEEAIRYAIHLDCEELIEALICFHESVLWPFTEAALTCLTSLASNAELDNHARINRILGVLHRIGSDQRLRGAAVDCGIWLFCEE